MSGALQRRRVGRALALSVLAAASACRLIAGIDEDVQVGEAAARDAGPGDASADGADGDAAAVEDAAVGDAVDAALACPTSSVHGPVMQLLPVQDGGGAFCIDVREVSVRQYREFTDALPQSGKSLSDFLDPLDPICGNLAGQQPTTGGPSVSSVYFEPDASTLDLPITKFYFCDAKAYCRWAGKRLCGALAHATDDRDAFADPTRDEWSYACTSAGRYAYGYGSTEMAQRCTGNRRKNSNGCGSASFPCEPTPVDWQDPSLPCRSPDAPFSAIYDLPGNVWEWTDVCQPTDAGFDCLLRGGSFYTDDPACGLAEHPSSQPYAGSSVSYSDDSVGFRCCADAIAP